MQRSFRYDVPAWENTCPLNGCHNCAHGESSLTSQWQFVSQKNAMQTHTKWN